MNEIICRGYLRDIEFSHSVGEIEYEKANLISPGKNGREDDIISLRYKKFANRYKEGDFVEIRGNLRSFSQRTDKGNSVQIYVFTYFDDVEEFPVYPVQIDGRICVIGEMRESRSGKKYIHFTLANNIFTSGGKKINNYIPCTAYGDLAEVLSNKQIGDIINVNGEFHSHSYKKEVNGETEYRVAHEVLVKEITNG